MEFFLDVHIPEEHKGECKLMVRAMRDGREYLPEQTFTLLDGPNTYTYGWHAATEAFLNQIRFYGPGIGTYDLNWQYKLEGGEYQTFHTSIHRIYLTAAKPTPSQGNRETLFYYACHQPDGNPGTDGKVVTHKIWEDFKTKSMQRINHGTGNLYGDPLRFWGAGGVSGIVIQDGVGVCGQWVDFFSNVLQVHGYASQAVKVDAKGMIFDDGSAHDNSGWIVKGCAKKASPWVAGDGAPHNGGQGNGAIARRWPQHDISRAFDELYDPSYGIDPAVDASDYEDKAVGWYHFSYIADITGNAVEVFQPRVSGGHKLIYK